MAEASQIILPKAIYLDANALIATPHTLETQPLAELVEMAAILRAGLFVPQIAAQEWLSHCCSDAVRQMNKVRGEAKQIGSLLGRKPLQIESIPDDDLRKVVRATQSARLETVGFKIIPTPQIQIEKLIDLFLEKTPPFGEGDKGFKDAVILETIFQHACQENSFDQIVVVSSDKVFGRQEVLSHFASRGVTAHVIDGTPQDLFPRTNEKLKSMIGRAKTTILDQMAKKDTDYAMQHEAEILAFVTKNATISMSLVKGYGLSQYGHEKGVNDQRLEHARIISIDKARPLRVESAFAYGSSPRTPNDDRKAFLIIVQLEIDLTVARINVFAEPKVLIDDAPALLEEQHSWRYPEVEESITVTRVIQVSASVSSVGFDTQEYQDLQLESIY